MGLPLGECPRRRIDHGDRRGWSRTSSIVLDLPARRGPGDRQGAACGASDDRIEKRRFRLHGGGCTRRVPGACTGHAPMWSPSTRVALVEETHRAIREQVQKRTPGSPSRAGSARRSIPGYGRVSADGEWSGQWPLRIRSPESMSYPCGPEDVFETHRHGGASGDVRLGDHRWVVPAAGRGARSENVYFQRASCFEEVVNHVARPSYVDEPVDREVLYTTRPSTGAPPKAWTIRNSSLPRLSSEWESLRIRTEGEYGGVGLEIVERERLGYGREPPSRNGPGTRRRRFGPVTGSIRDGEGVPADTRGGARTRRWRSSGASPGTERRRSKMVRPGVEPSPFEFTLDPRRDPAT